MRNLERELANVLRKVARDKVEKKTKKVNISKKKVNEYLGAPSFYSEIAERVTKPGVVTGLAWTAAGGDILFIESSKMKGTGKLTLTGQLGDVMKESATAALTYVRSHTDILGFKEDFHEKTDIHVHVPAGAIPKDGPSAGVGMFTSLVSLLSGTPVQTGVAMTGEITLRGNVLPIGGVKEKVTAAHRSGIKTIILPNHNKKDLEEIPCHIKKDLSFHFVQLAPYRYNRGDALPDIWEAQVATLSVPGTGMAIITDIGNNQDIHPRNKQDVGKRLALWALAKDYGKENSVYCGPLYKSMQVEGEKIRIQFAHTGTGLVSRDGKDLTDFIISGSNGEFVAAKATIDGHTVLVSAENVTEPKNVRFGWQEIVNPNLSNKEGLPASPFRTDDWKGSTGQ